MSTPSLEARPALPPAPSSPTPYRVPTPKAFLPHFQRLTETLKGTRFEPVTDYATELEREAKEGIQAFLDEKFHPSAPLASQVDMLDELRQLLALEERSRPEVRLADLDNDGMLEVVVSPGTRSIPAYAFRREQDRFVGYAIPFNILGLPWPDYSGILKMGGVSRIEWIGDVNQDGWKEVVLTYRWVPGSAGITTLIIARWAGSGFTSIFTASLSDRNGPTWWSLTPRNGEKDVVITCRLVGLYDHHLAPHQLETDTYRWEGGQFRLLTADIQPPQTLRQQVNVAEVFFRQGEFWQAIAEYRLVLESPTLEAEKDASGADWRAYARFRMGESYAFLGQPEEARQALEEAARAGSLLGEMAATFLENYKGPDGAARGLASLLKLGLGERIYQGERGNLSWFIDELGLLYPGFSLAAYLEAHPEAAGKAAEALAGDLKGLGLVTEKVVVADLDGDGLPEVAASIPLTRRGSAWLVFQKGGRWAVRDLSGYEYDYALEGAREMGAASRALVWRPTRVLTLPERLVGWDGSSILFSSIPNPQLLRPVPFRPGYSTPCPVGP